MSQTLNSKIAVIGIDIGKNSFHIVGQDRHGALVLRQKWSRGQVEARLTNLPPCTSITNAYRLSARSFVAVQVEKHSEDRFGCAPWKGGAFQWV